MKQAVALRPTTGLPAQLSALQETHGLTLVEIETVQTILQEYRTNLPTIENLLKYGLTVVEVGQVYDARGRINERLSKSELAQQVSLKQIVRFQRAFRSEPLDADALVERVVAIHDRFQDQYLDQMLSQLGELSKRHPDALPEALADLMAGSLDFDVSDNHE